MEKSTKIYIAGHRGMVGSGIERNLRAEGYHNILTRASQDLDLRNQSAVLEFFKSEKPEVVILAAAKVGGILANNVFRADFVYDNLMIEANVIHASYLVNVSKLLFLGSSCIYPKLAPQPLKEEYLLTGQLESTNQPYAIAKIAGIELCDSYRDQYGCDFISAMPTNLYGTNDNYHPTNSHVLPSLVRKIVNAKNSDSDSVDIWGTGFPRREFLHVDDLSDACVFLLNNYSERGIVNIGTGTDVTIRELAEEIARIVGYSGNLIFDTSKPDGTPRKLMDISKLTSMGWSYRIDLLAGLKMTIKEYMTKYPEER